MNVMVVNKYFINRLELDYKMGKEFVFSVKTEVIMNIWMNNVMS